MVLIHMIYSVCFWLNAFPIKSGTAGGMSPREIVTGQKIEYSKDCRADFGSYVEASSDDIFTNDQYPRTHACIALGPSRNQQGSLKCFDLLTGNVVTRRTFTQMTWPACMIKKASAWGRRGTADIVKGQIHFLNRRKEKFDWDNDDLDELEVRLDEPSLCLSALLEIDKDLSSVLTY